MIEKLKVRLEHKNLLERTPIRGSIEMILTLAAFILFLYSITIISAPVIFGIILAIIMSRAIFIIHDVLHTQYFKSKKFSRNLSRIFIILVGNSPSWWASNHQLSHHPWANVRGKDNDLPLTETSKLKFLLGSFIVYGYLIVESYKFVIRHKLFVELFLMLFHWAFVWLPLYLILGWKFLIVMIISYTVLSIWLWLGFSMNHMACKVLSITEANSLDKFTKHLITTRSLYPGVFTQWFYGGLNAHIEHHLFPTASRFKMLEIQEETRNFCSQHNLYYKISSPAFAYKEIFLSLL